MFEGLSRYFSPERRLLRAFRSGASETEILRFLDSHPKIDVNICDEKGKSILSYGLSAINTSTHKPLYSRKLFDKLFEMGANPFFADTRGNIPFSLIIEKDYITPAVLDKLPKLSTLNVPNLASIEQPLLHSFTTYNAYNGHIGTINQLIHHDPDLLTVRDTKGYTALEKLLLNVPHKDQKKSDYLLFLDLLLLQNPDISALNNGEKPFGHKLLENHVHSTNDITTEVFFHLLRNGVDLSQPDAEDNTLLHTWAHSFNLEKNVNHASDLEEINQESEKIFEALYTPQTANAVNKFHQTPLVYALHFCAQTQKATESRVAHLQKNGTSYAQVISPSEYHYTRTNEVLLLLKKEETSASLADIYGNIGLHYAVQAKMADTFDALIYRGSDPFKENNEGISPYAMVLQSADEQLINAFEKVVREYPCYAHELPKKKRKALHEQRSAMAKKIADIRAQYRTQEAKEKYPTPAERNKAIQTAVQKMKSNQSEL